MIFIGLNNYLVKCIVVFVCYGVWIDVFYFFGEIIIDCVVISCDFYIGFLIGIKKCNILWLDFCFDQECVVDWNDFCDVFVWCYDGVDGCNGKFVDDFVNWCL